MQFLLKTFDSFNTTISILNVEIYKARITLGTGKEKHGKSLERPGNYKKTVSARAINSWSVYYCDRTILAITRLNVQILNVLYFLVFEA